MQTANSKVNQQLSDCHALGGGSCSHGGRLSSVMGAVNELSAWWSWGLFLRICGHAWFHTHYKGRTWTHTSINFTKNGSDSVPPVEPFWKRPVDQTIHLNRLFQFDCYFFYRYAPPLSWCLFVLQRILLQGLPLHHRWVLQRCISRPALVIEAFEDPPPHPPSSLLPSSSPFEVSMWSCAERRASSPPRLILSAQAAHSCGLHPRHGTRRMFGQPGGAPSPFRPEDSGRRPGFSCWDGWSRRSCGGTLNCGEKKTVLRLSCLNNIFIEAGYREKFPELIWFNLDQFNSDIFFLFLSSI